VLLLLRERRERAEKVQRRALLLLRSHAAKVLMRRAAEGSAEGAPLPQHATCSLLVSRRYRAVFHERVAPYANVLINGMYWDQRYPRLLTKKHIKTLSNGGNVGYGLVAIADISCDIGGSVEFMSKSTHVEKPYYLYDPETDSTSDSVMQDGIVISAVDILPSELPRESSRFFGDALVGLLPSVLSPESKEPAPELMGATVAEGGELLENFSYIEQLKNDVILGAKSEVNQASPARKAQSGNGISDDKSLMLVLDGHLFDSGLLNTVLDLFEANKCGVEIDSIDVGQGVGGSEPSHAVLKVSERGRERSEGAERGSAAAERGERSREASAAASARKRCCTPITHTRAYPLSLFSLSPCVCALAQGFLPQPRRIHVRAEGRRQEGRGPRAPAPQRRGHR
jgi:hypothetical protein